MSDTFMVMIPEQTNGLSTGYVLHDGKGQYWCPGPKRFGPIRKAKVWSEMKNIKLHLSGYIDFDGTSNVDPKWEIVQVSLVPTSRISALEATKEMADRKKKRSAGYKSQWELNRANQEKTTLRRLRKKYPNV